MEDCITFVDVFAPFLFFKLPWKTEDKAIEEMFKRQWGALRQAIMICLRPDTSKSLGSQVAAYRTCINAYHRAAMEVGHLQMGCTRRELRMVVSMVLLLTVCDVYTCVGIRRSRFDDIEIALRKAARRRSDGLSWVPAQVPGVLG